MKWMKATVVAAVIGLGAGCFGSIATGCSSASTGTGPSSNPHAEHVIGAQGGAVVVPDGTGVNIPAGALPDGVTVTVDQDPTAATPSGGRTVSTPYVFGPEGQKFDVPVTVTLAFDPTLLPPGKHASDVFVYTAPVGTTAYEPLVTTLVDGTHISAQVMHFSVFCGFVPSAPPSFDAGTDASTGLPDASEPIDSSTGEPDTSAADDSSTDQGDANALPDSSIDDASASHDASAGPDSSTDGGSTQTDAATIDDAGGSLDAGSGGSDGGSTQADAGADASACNRQTQWPAMESATIIPPSQYANVDWKNGATTVDQAMAINCAPAPAQPINDLSDKAFTWGNTQDVYVEFNPQTRLPVFLMLEHSYSGTLTLFSRNGGAYGNHTYVIGVGTLTRDGSPMTLDWVNGPDSAVTELYDAFLATITPAAQAASADCVTSKQCLASEDDGDGTSSFGFRSDPNFYVVVAKDTSTVTMLYTFFKANSFAPDGGGAGGSDASAGDGGTCNPIPPQVACQNQCGVSVSNGCGGGYQCGPCNDGGGAFDGGGPADASPGGDACSPIPMQIACSGACGTNAGNGCGGFYPCPPCGDGGGGPIDAGGPPSDGGASDGGPCNPIPYQLACQGHSCGLVSNGCAQVYQCGPPCQDAGAPHDAGP